MILTDGLSQLRAMVAPLLPRHRRWKKFLRKLPLDPDQLPRPVETPTRRDFIICGSPRTGTTLLAAMLFQPPSVITVMEPWDGMRLPPAQLFASVRTEIAETGHLQRGKLDLETLLAEGVVRWCPEGESNPTITVSSDYLLGIKWPAYWRYLELLPETNFLVCLRHPFEVINSCRRVGGRLAQGLEYDTAFNRQMNEALTSATDSLALRRIFLYDYVNERIGEHLARPNVFVVRFEQWFENSGKLLADLGAFLGLNLGPGPAILRSPAASFVLSAAEIALIRKHCRTAELLGYSLDRAPVYLNQKLL